MSMVLQQNVYVMDDNSTNIVSKVLKFHNIIHYIMNKSYGTIVSRGCGAYY